MSDPLVVIDADVLGRRRTGDESYIYGLLQALPAVGDGFRFAAVTRRPDLVPPGIEPIELPARVQELRMAVRLPLLLRRLRPRSPISSTRCRRPFPARPFSPCRTCPSSGTCR